MKKLKKWAYYLKLAFEELERLALNEPRAIEELEKEK
jgi:hypothetical protein